MKKNIKNKIVIYQASDGSIELSGDIKKQTIWATQSQIAKVFNIDRSVATKHIGNIFKSKEVDQKSNVQKMHIPNSDKPVIFYSLDIILAVGYRTNSAKAIAFRKWATKTLREYIIKGYAINKKRIKYNYQEFFKTIDNIKKLLPPSRTIDNENVLELVSAFANTWFSLDAYDKDSLIKNGFTKKAVNFTANNLVNALKNFKNELIKKSKINYLFGKEREKDTVSGIVGNVMQSFNGKSLYPTIEEKAAHLLYFMVKNHPFIDGNKRSGAYAFIWFLKKSDILNPTKMTPETLTALTLLIAESNPKHKDKMIGLILQLLIK